MPLIHETLVNINLGTVFEIILDHIGAFPKPNKAHSLWIGASVGSQQLTELVHKTGEGLLKLHFSSDSHPYVPHITVQKFKPAHNIRKLIEKHPLQSVSMIVDHLVLYESILDNGVPQYIELYVYPLHK